MAFLIFIQGAKSISILLNKAKDTIPVDKREHTPVALKATAGLRLLPANVSMQLLEEVCIQRWRGGNVLKIFVLMVVSGNSIAKKKRVF